MIKTSGNPYKLIKQLKEQKQDFEVRKTTKSTLIKFGKFSYMYADSHFKNMHLNLFQQLKKEVHSNIIKNKIVVPEIVKSKYFDHRQFEKIGEGEFLTFNNVIEFDINKAYYNVLKKFKYISEDFYNKCIKLPKNIRLALVGSLATKKTIFYYQKGELLYFEDEADDLLRRVFFHLVEYTDMVLDRFSKLSKDHFLFYWVDGIYLNNYDRAHWHKDLISYEYDIDFSFESLQNLMVYNQGEYNTKIVIKKMNGKIKSFNLNNIFVI